MIRYVSITNFKSLKQVDATTRPLTLLYGLNGSGKSSFLQALLFLGKTLCNPKADAVLNDVRLRLGRQRDVFYCYTATSGAKITLKAKGDNDDEVSLECPFLDYDSESLPWDALSTVLGTGGLVEAFSDLQYISASRPEPTLAQRYNLSEIERRNWGRQGENAVAYLFEHGNTLVHDAMLHAGDNEKAYKSLRLQVNAWLADISPGAALVLERKIGADTLDMKIRFSGGTDAYRFRPENVGFGISIVLPLLIMILSAQPGNILLLENPEAHLHPSGQAHLGELIAKAASAGIQLFVETHSDHVINGVRVAISQKVLSPADAEVLFFKREIQSADSATDGVAEQFTQCRQISFDESGEIDEYPDGFMDEWNKQVLKLW